MSTPVQNEIVRTKEESQSRTSHAIRQEMNVYRGMILNYVLIQINCVTTTWPTILILMTRRRDHKMSIFIPPSVELFFKILPPFVKMPP